MLELFKVIYKGTNYNTNQACNNKKESHILIRAQEERECRVKDPDRAKPRKSHLLYYKYKY